MATNNAINLQGPTPAFSAYLGTTDSNVTGSSILYRLGSGNALTELYDYTNSFNTNGIFTAPVAGVYQFNGAIHYFSMMPEDVGIISIHTTQHVFEYPFGTRFTETFDAIAFSTSANMAIGETAYLNFLVNSGSQIVDVYGGADIRTFFNGFLVAKI
jgi:hypothetical protein